MIDWDDAFDNSGHIADAPVHVQDWVSRAQAYRAQMTEATRVQSDIVYGSRERNRLDLFVPDGESRGLVVFVHGGYWRSLDKSYWSHLARGPVERGWSVVVAGYTLTPRVRVAGITAEIGQAIDCAAQLAGGPIRLIGHSAGGHLVARMVCADSPLNEAILKRIVRVVPVSGVFDLRPLTMTRMNDDLRLTDAEAMSESPCFSAPHPDMAVSLWVGAAERPEFLRQTRLMGEAWEKQCRTFSETYERDRNHFTVIAGLESPRSAIVAELLA